MAAGRILEMLALRMDRPSAHQKGDERKDRHQLLGLFMRREMDIQLVIESDGSDSYIRGDHHGNLLFAFRLPAQGKSHPNIIVDPGCLLLAKAEKIRQKAEREND